MILRLLICSPETRSRLPPTEKSTKSLHNGGLFDAWIQVASESKLSTVINRPYNDMCENSENEAHFCGEIVQTLRFSLPEEKWSKITRFRIFYPRYASFCFIWADVLVYGYERRHSISESRQNGLAINKKGHDA